MKRRKGGTEEGIKLRRKMGKGKGEKGGRGKGWGEGFRWSRDVWTLTGHYNAGKNRPRHRIHNVYTKLATIYSKQGTVYTFIQICNIL